MLLPDESLAVQGSSDLGRETHPLCLSELPIHVPQGREILLRVSCCGICHTELDEIEGRTPPPSYPVIPGHQVVGRVEAARPQVTSFTIGKRVGVA